MSNTPQNEAWAVTIFKDATKDDEAELLLPQDGTTNVVIAPSRGLAIALAGFKIPEDLRTLKGLQGIRIGVQCTTDPSQDRYNYDFGSSSRGQRIEAWTVTIFKDATATTDAELLLPQDGVHNTVLAPNRDIATLLAGFRLPDGLQNLKGLQSIRLGVQCSTNPSLNF